MKRLINRRTAMTMGALGIVASLSSAAKADWPFQRRYGMFLIHADFAPHGYLQLFDELVQLREKVATQLNLQLSDEQIDVYLFSNKAVYQNYMRRYFPSVSPRRAMFIKSNSPGNVFAYASRDIAIDLRHETTHAILHATLPMVPLWLDEGLAEYFEVPTEQRANGNSHLSTTRRELKWKRPTPLPRLERMTTLQEMGGDEYREAWSWVHFMLHGPEPAQLALREYLESISRHEPPLPLSQSLSTRFRSPERALAQHFQGVK